MALAIARRSMLAPKIPMFSSSSPRGNDSVSQTQPWQPSGSYTAPTKQQRTPTRPSLAPHDDRFAVVVVSPVAEFLEFFSLIWIPRGRIAVQIYSSVLVKVRADASIQGHGHASATIVLGH